MDKFADFVEEARASNESAENDNNQEQAAEWSDFERNTNVAQPFKVKVAIIDDGVKSSVNGLDDLIERGESWVEQATPKHRYSPYTTSSRGHGTVMAYYIRRVCPNVSLYVAKLNPQIIQGRVTFTIESATKVDISVFFHRPFRSNATDNSDRQLSGRSRKMSISYP